MNASTTFNRGGNSGVVPPQPPASDPLAEFDKVDTLHASNDLTDPGLERPVSSIRNTAMRQLAIAASQNLLD